MSHDRSTIPIPCFNGSSRQRLPLHLLCMVLWLPGCTSSLARLPSEPFETRLANAYAHDPLSVSARLSLADESSRALIAEPVRPVTAALVVDSPSERVTVNAVKAPLSALLHALATQTRLQLQVIGSMDAQVSLKLEQQHISVVLEQLADQAAFAWEISNDTLTIWNGDAYAHSYAIDYLNIDRRTQSSVGLATQVGTINASGDGASSIANSSQTRVENTSEHQFWGSVQADVEKLVSVQRASALQGLSVGKKRAGRSSSGLSGMTASRPEFTINREAGLLNVYAIPAIHRSVKRYLQQLHDSASRQVLIEATVVEVALSDSFEAGVDWQVLASGVNGFSAIQALVGAPFVNDESVDRVVPPAGLMSLVQQGGQADIGATLSLLEQFGDVRILSRPRIIALNNQSSVLKVVDNRVYFTVNIERRQTETRDEIVTESEIHTVPVGLVMNVTPQISRSGAVMLNVRPTLSRILGFVNDPNPELAEANVRNGVPEIQVREMESMLLVQSGNMAIIGGLMQDTSEGNDAQLPGLGNLPVLKHLFSRRSRNRRQTELLIVLRPTVIVADTQVMASR